MRISVLLGGVALAQVASAATAVALCDSPIYCEGPLLKTVQMARLFHDSKTFVDMPTSKPVDQVLASFKEIGGEKATKDALKQFVDQNFLQAGSEMVQLTFPVQSPEWMEKIDDLTYRGWMSSLNDAWANLTFSYDTSRLCDGCATSTLPVKRRFVVPGGRFREFYYWDSYFVLRGLLLSDLHDLAKDVVHNLLDFVETYGFMPNGARIYFLNRSQPPFLSEMVKIYYETTGDRSTLDRALPILDKEYRFWLANTTVTIKDPHSRRKYKLNRYNVETDAPRPESYIEDYQTAYEGTGFTTQQATDLYSELATGAETGWDYASRWTKNRTPTPGQKNGYDILRTLNARSIIPIDLNTLLWNMETTLSGWHAKYGKGHSKQRKSRYYRNQAANRLEAMDKLMWNPKDFSFYDFNLTSQAQNIEFTPANIFPFWVGAIPKRVKQTNVLRHVFDQTRDALAKYPGVLTTSLFNTTLQWDWPNGWPPLQYVTINAMLRVEKLLKEQGQSSDLLDMAKNMAERNTASAFCSWYKTGGTVPGLLQSYPEAGNDTGHMFEKFDVRNLGAAGSGGEYEVQTGFGWTNGVAMWILNRFSNITAPDCTSTINYPLAPSS
ncbi:hypothetical protein DFQ28_003600 [Apophysomyces sp. BC1034]|nr:hypothetical protein DFQ29_007171 [Apophysomyces sp. BC1021]KAG0189277.1 hypothetical protein DFQ28_003600 [Apophysomyces sp. BC1034]